MTLLLLTFNLLVLGVLSLAFSVLLEKKVSLSFSDKAVIGFFFSVFSCIGLFVLAKKLAPSHLETLFYLMALLSNVLSCMFFFVRSSTSLKHFSSTEAFRVFLEKFSLTEAVFNVFSGGIQWWGINLIFKSYIRRRARFCNRCDHPMLFVESQVQHLKEDLWTCCNCESKHKYNYVEKEFFRDCPRCGKDDWDSNPDNSTKPIRLIYAPTLESSLMKCRQCGHTEKLQILNPLSEDTQLNSHKSEQ